jgi:FtsP/CotA-like multicopper oxidase with cupredoxin domain
MKGRSHMNRREFSKLLVASSGLIAATNTLVSHGRVAMAAGTPLKLDVVSRTLDIDGKAAKVYGLVGPGGKPGLRLTAGTTADIDVANGLSKETMIHWHGLKPEWPMDGVPGMPMPLLKVGESRRYSLPAGRTGTHWMHAHTLQEQSLLAAPLIVEEEDSATRDEQEAVVLLHDFSFKSPEELLARLKSSGMTSMDGMNMQGMDHSNMPGMNMGGMMAMDINDIEYDAYLANDRTLNDPEMVKVEKGGNVRLRIINGATATAFTIDTGALDGEVTAVDGQDIVPLRTRQFPLTMGQRVDFRFQIPREGGAFPVLALREGAPQRTGVILATSGANIAKVASSGETDGPILSLDLERGLTPISPLAAGTNGKRFTVDLGGDMESYRWSIRPNADLIVNEGDRVSIEMRNRSMMAHPMHLHGHHFQIVAIDGEPIVGAVRDTVLVPPMMSVKFAFDANNPGQDWAFHCHHLYHMATGMMTAIAYA